MTVDAKVVRSLREKTGAGIMDCKEALVNAEGDMDKAVELLRKLGIAKAEKKVGRKADQGVVLSYVHPGNRIGVLVEVNCETDFVAKTDGFTSLVKDLAMQVAATGPMAITREEIDETTVDREKDIYREQAKSMGKPDNVVDKVVEGRLEKFYQENCLLEQQFIKDHEKTVQNLIKENIAALGENIAVARFARFEVGEGPSSNGEV
ncbi:MAG: translation elongation factor Ts [Candidatus Marinimicrobia bacterium]|jgi:elongation factor Ts|nr:translation elongation factor Ts [Candidatus Neomarinimicrobiota bacterium]MDP6456910.1 translation elongation factor Ts [Candidatus Neomarinimicrobiota bacterium]MDP6592787.1 translation elongation factor Ts [Candidatus Neomarinimicrobiota bacterium]MDP6836308.1 translation elongation factor Ts [Candidatus Neomarinimicrobiota bacterium]|tara:strand:- start:4078 stop:4695 length:618 start_codon:yes stop_codon:yes gene_type:complete